MTSTFTARDEELLSLIAQSLAPAPTGNAIEIQAFGAPDEIRRLHGLNLPAREWMHECIQQLVESAKGIPELVESLGYLGSDPDPIAEFSDAWICAGVVVYGDPAEKWVEQVLSDPFYLRIIDNTRDYDLADSAYDALDDWAESLDFVELGHKFIGLAKFGPRNVAGQSCEAVLEAAGLLPELP